MAPRGFRLFTGFQPASNEPWPATAADPCNNVPVVLHTAYAAAASASRPPNGVVPGLCGDDLLLEACQQQLRFGQGQTQIGYITEIIGPVDLNDIRGLPLALSADLHQPHNPGHASTPG